jgi:hypothetical protein
MKQPWTCRWTSGSPRPALPWPSGYEGPDLGRGGRSAALVYPGRLVGHRRTAAPVGSGDLVSIEYCRVQVRLDLYIGTAHVHAAP